GLQSLHEKFKDIVLQNNIAVLSFGETRKSRWGLNLTVLVSLDSSDPGFGEFYALPVDHLSTCKPESPDSMMYTKLLHFLKNHVPP
ncbi:Protein SERAC1, partial [Stegodyphus mimosarum]